VPVDAPDISPENALKARMITPEPPSPAIVEPVALEPPPPPVFFVPELPLPLVEPAPPPPFTATCSWRPTGHGTVIISAVATPVAGGITVGKSLPIAVSIANRTVKR